MDRVSVTYNVIGRAITQFLFLTTQTSIWKLLLGRTLSDFSMITFAISFTAMYLSGFTLLKSIP